MLFVFVAMEVGSRHILHCNVTAHPTADWTLQQLREAISGGHGYQFLIHDCDSIFSSDLDEEEVPALVWVESLTDARAGAAGECVLRTTERNLATGVSGLHDPDERVTPRTTLRSSARRHDSSLFSFGTGCTGPEHLNDCRPIIRPRELAFSDLPSIQ